ncbi:MAG: DUF4215 domain-containing protein [Candidatus Dadabacteria bacterium]
MSTQSLARKLTSKLFSSVILFSLFIIIALFFHIKFSYVDSSGMNAVAQGTCDPDYDPSNPDLDFSFMTDKEEYAVEEIVYMIGEGNDCAVELMITVTSPDGNQATDFVVTNEYGNFSYDYILGNIEGEYLAEVRTADGITLLGSDKFHALSATVATDKSDYAPGENVEITGSGWKPGETVELEIVEEPLVHEAEKLYATADELRNIFNSEYLIKDHDVGQAFTLLATGIESGLTAFTNFTDHLQLFFSSFGNTNTTNIGSVDGWVESDDNDGDDCRITDTSERTASTTDQHARLCGCAITRSVSTAGHNSIELRYYCRGDSDASSSQRLNVLADLNGNGLFTDADEQLASHTIDGSSSSCPSGGWSSQKVISLPAVANDNANFKIRFVSTTSDCSGDDIEEPRIDDVEVLGVDIPVCGDGITGTGESCDDGNTTGGDGCSATCTTETGYYCIGAPSDCCQIVSNFRECFDLGTSDTNCIDDSGQSDTVDSNNAPAWSETPGADASDCAIRNEELRLRSGCAVTQTSISTVGYTNIHLLYLWGADIDSDQGDDGDLMVDWRVTGGSFSLPNVHDLTGDTIPANNFVDFPLSAAANNTTIDIRFNGATTEDNDQAFVDDIVLCGDPTVCGDGVIAGAETCDDGGTIDGDGCSSSCQEETGYDCTGTPSVCTAVCGDGVIAGAETCDDGGTIDGDGCSSTCQEETGYDCTGTPSVCTGVCGDGIIAGAETCDDGNTANGDCCSATCQIDEDGTSCADGNACDGAETCQSGTCTAGTPLTCDNGLFCDGLETCNPSTGCENGPVPSTDDGVGCTTDACDEGTDTITHTPVDSVCSDGLFCNGTETCNITLGCQDGPGPSTDDGVGCTTDACDEVNDTITHTPVDSVCDNGQFCDGSETCNLTLGCQNGAPPQTDDGAECTTDSCDEENDVIVNAPNDDFCSDDLLCTADVCAPDADGADESTGCTNDFDEDVCFASLSSSSLCLFDVDNGVDGCQFKLIFTPDQNSTSAWKQNASNPGQYYYNTFYIGDGEETINITVPYPFVTQGAVPIHIYDSVGGVPSGETGCYLPGTEIGHSSAQIKIDDYSGAGDTVTIPVEIPHVEDGYAYINIHLDYGLKGSSGYSKNALDDAVDSNNLSNIIIPNFGGYSFDDNSLTSGYVCQNKNVFKRAPGIGGLVLEADGDPAANVKVQIYQGTKLMKTVYTDDDGWYMWQFKYTGKATTFTVTLPDYGLSKNLTLKSNGYIIVSFTLQ